MANHVRQQLREAIATAITGLTTTSTRVFQSRVYPIEVGQLPCIVVTSDGDDITAQSVHRPYEQSRTTRIRIEAYAQAVSDLDDTLDLICKEVEIALGNLSSGIGADCYLIGTNLDFDSIGEKPVGRATMLYTKDLWTLSNAPDVLI
jgi:hypothetical protein